MLKKLSTLAAIIAVSVSAFVGISSAQAVGGSNDATLSELLVRGNALPTQDKFSQTAAMQSLREGEFFYDVVVSVPDLRVITKTTDPLATVKINGGGATNLVPTLMTDVSWTTYKSGRIDVTEAANQIVTVTVTAADGVTTQTYTLSISNAILPQPQLISNSLTSLSTARGDKGVMYVKNYTPCSFISYTYPYINPSNGEEYTDTVKVYPEFITTDNNGVSKVIWEGEGTYKTLRNDSAIADLTISNYTGYNYNEGGCLGQRFSHGEYSELFVPKAFTFYNPTITAVEIPATISQHTAFKISGKGMNANANLDFYVINNATGKTSWMETRYINADSLLATVSGRDFSDNFKSAQDLDFVIEQYDNCDNDNDPCADSVELYRKSVKFKPEMATQVSVSPAKGSVIGGNKVTITGHGICNPDGYGANRLAKITIGGVEVTDLRLLSNCDYKTSSDGISWDGQDRATFLVPAGAPGQAAITVDMGYGPTTLSQKYTYGAKPTISSIAPATVAKTGGSIITLNGADFGIAGTPVVIINGVKSPYVQRLSSTKVLAMVPASETTGQVDVDIISSSGGGSLDVLSKITYAASTTNPTVTSISPATDGVAGGNTIVINGTGFSTTASGVTIAGIPAKITAATATKLTVEVPSGDAAGVFDVVVGTPTGLLTKANAFTFTADPGVTSVTPNSINSTATGADAKVTIVGVGFGASGTIAFGAGTPVAYSATAGGTTISNVAVPTNVAGSIKVSSICNSCKS